jgi:Domain of unknown function (DUF4126)
VAVTPTPEPFSNIALSTAEDALAIFLIWFSTQHPFWAAGIVFGLLATAVALARWIVGAIRTRVGRRPLHRS